MNLEQLRLDIATITGYNWRSERDDYAAHDGEGANHVFPALVRLDNFVHGTEHGTEHYIDGGQEPVGADIIEAAAKAFFASAWADLKDEQGTTWAYPGENIYDVMPDDIDPAATHAARTLAMDYERASGETLGEAFQRVRQHAAYPSEPFTPEAFGYLAAMQAMGSGVGFQDRGVDLEVPNIEFGSYSLEKDY